MKPDALFYRQLGYALLQSTVAIGGGILHCFIAHLCR